MHAVCATMLVFEALVEFPWIGGFVNDDAVLGWVGRNASKPRRGDADTWVLHGTRAWSAAHLDESSDAIGDAMTSAFERLVHPKVAPIHRVVHRWRYALPDPVTSEAAMYSGVLGLGAGGDWCAGPRIEGALLSGIALAGRVMTSAHTNATRDG